MQLLLVPSKSGLSFTGIGINSLDENQPACLGHIKHYCFLVVFIKISCECDDYIGVDENETIGVYRLVGL